MKKTILISAMMLFSISWFSEGVIASQNTALAVSLSTKKCKITVSGTYNGNAVDGTVEVEGMTCAELIKSLVQK